jgi:hypothetical protein
MANQELAVCVPSRGHYIGRLKARLIARRSIALVGFYLAFHWWGLKAFPIMAYGLFMAYLIIRMEFAERRFVSRR